MSRTAPFPDVSPHSTRGAGPKLDPVVARALGTNVRIARMSAELSQEDLVERSGIAIASVQRIEAGNANPSLATLYALAEGVRCDVADLIPSKAQVAELGEEE